MAETTSYNVENAMKDQEQNQNKVAKDAVQMAKENIAKRKLEEESRKVESRLQEASRQEDRALKELRVNRKHEAAAKKYLADINAAKTTFESTGDSVSTGISSCVSASSQPRAMSMGLRIESIASSSQSMVPSRLTVIEPT